MGSRLPVLLVGELNPYGSDDDWALWPAPAGCAGDRLCRVVMGIDSEDYVERFYRTNLCYRRWDSGMAQDRATVLSHPPAGSRLDWDRIVLLGRKVASAFGYVGEFFDEWQRHPICPRLLALPHPSGRCRMWNGHGVGRARAALARFIPEVKFGAC